MERTSVTPIFINVNCNNFSVSSNLQKNCHIKERNRKKPSFEELFAAIDTGILCLKVKACISSPAKKQKYNSTKFALRKNYLDYEFTDFKFFPHKGVRSNFILVTVFQSNFVTSSVHLFTQAILFAEFHDHYDWISQSLGYEEIVFLKVGTH